MGSAYQFHSWRVFVVVCALPCVCSVVALTFMPESPRFYLEVRKPNSRKQAMNVVCRDFILQHRSRFCIQAACTATSRLYWILFMFGIPHCFCLGGEAWRSVDDPQADSRHQHASSRTAWESLHRKSGVKAKLALKLNNRMNVKPLSCNSGF